MNLRDLKNIMKEVNEPNEYELFAHDLEHPFYWIFKVENVRVKTLYKESVDKQDYNSAKVYLQNIRNLQKTERDIFEVKKQKNDLSIEQRKVDSAATQSNTLSPESNIVLKEKQTSDLVTEAENIVQRTKLQQKQLNIKDEYLLEKFSDDDKIIKEIDNTLNSKPTIKDSLNAGINCVIRSISG